MFVAHIITSVSNSWSEMVKVWANGHNLVPFDHHRDKGWRRNGKMQVFVPVITEMFSVAAPLRWKVRLRWKVGVIRPPIPTMVMG